MSLTPGSYVGEELTGLPRGSTKKSRHGAMASRT